MLYLDSSALVKHYIREVGTESQNAKLRKEERAGFPMFTSVLSYAEIHAMIRRRLAEKLLSERETSQLQDQFDADWLYSFTAVELNAGVLVAIRDMFQHVYVRGADAVHLGSALWLRDSLRLSQRARSGSASNLVFACSDQLLNKAATHFGLEVFNPEKTK